MRGRIAAVALLSALAAGCSSSSSGGGSTPTHSPAPTPTFKQLGTLAVAQVSDAIRFSGTTCPQELPEVDLEADQVIACNARPRRVYVLEEPALDERAVDATTVAKQGGGRWTVYLQLTPSGVRAFAGIGGRYAIVFNGVVVKTAPVVTPGGLLQITDLSKVSARRMATALNPS